MKAGAYDYLAKPYDLAELRLVVSRAMERQELRQEVLELRERLAGEGQFGGMVGVSAVMRDLFQAAERIAQTDLPVLLLGESGTGKDVLAREIHARSPRARQRLVALNCAALPEALVESELFGAEKGAFTGASATRAGKFEQAHRGTLFLDEIGDMNLPTQAKILRASESGAIERLGGSKVIRVDVRLISATNQELQSAIERGQFRQDLYFRLAGATLYLPPLRGRRDDIPVLVARFWADLQRKYRSDGPDLSREALSRLEESSWPGNVRQLRNTVEKLFVLPRGDRVTSDDVVSALGPERPPQASAGAGPMAIGNLREARRLFEIQFLTRKLQEHGGNVTRTAEAIGIERQSLQEKLKKLGVVRE
jgi:DNA-binding NtrC family response regulator